MTRKQDQRPALGGSWFEACQATDGNARPLIATGEASHGSKGQPL